LDARISRTIVVDDTVLGANFGRRNGSVGIRERPLGRLRILPRTVEHVRDLIAATPFDAQGRVPIEVFVNVLRRSRILATGG
jgi:hypothetical protein